MTFESQKSVFAESASFSSIYLQSWKWGDLTNFRVKQSSALRHWKLTLSALPRLSIQQANLQSWSLHGLFDAERQKGIPNTNFHIFCMTRQCNEPRSPKCRVRSGGRSYN